MVRHELGAGRAVEADREGLEVLERRVERLDPLPGQHGAHGLDGAADQQGQRRAAGGHRLAHADGGRLQVQGVLRRLEEQGVDAAVDQGLGLDGVGRRHLVEGDIAGDGDRPRPRSHGADGEARLRGRRARVHGGAGEPGRGQGDLVGAVGEAILGQHVGRAAEGVGRDEVGAGAEVGVVDGPHHLGSRQVEVLVTSLEGRAAEVLGMELARLDHGAHGAVEHEDAAREGVGEAGGGGQRVHESILARTALARTLRCARARRDPRPCPPWSGSGHRALVRLSW